MSATPSRSRWERIFSGCFRGTVKQGREIHASSVAGKARHRSKKTSAVSRRPKKAAPRRIDSQPARAGARRRPPVANARPKPDGEGATPGMTVKKATQRQGFKTSEFIVYPAHGVGQILA